MTSMSVREIQCLIAGFRMPSRMPIVKVRRQCSEIVRPYNLNFAMLCSGYGTVTPSPRGAPLGEGRAQSCIADCKGRVGGLVIFSSSSKQVAEG
jgi:hypothetical protein